MPRLKLAARAAVDTGDTREGFRFAPCNGVYVGKTRTIGEGVATKIQFEPTATARLHSANVLINPILLAWSVSESYVTYGDMWEELNRCATFPRNLTTRQRHSLYMQMACHARFGALPKFGGNTWDLEAWLKDVEWGVGLAMANECQRYGNVDASDYLNKMDGRIVHSSLDTDQHLASWLVAGRERRPIESSEAYQCLTRFHGKAPAVLFAGEFLNIYLAKRGSVVRAGEVCPRTAPVPGPAPTPATGSVAPAPAGPGPGPQPQPRGFHIEDYFLGGTWARSDPNNGTWHSQGNRPANGAYWYPNGLGVGVDCARAAASYVVKWADGRSETWNTWFHVTDGKWYPAAASREVSVNGFYGLPAC